ncbi:MAG: prolyl-tRNA synthetase associated domain-containing protein [Pseudomonadota bacterium]
MDTVDTVDDGLMDLLERAGWDGDMVEHVAVYTIDEALAAVPHLDGIKTKNVFIRDAKGTRHLLLIVPHDKRIDLPELARHLPSSKLSMGSAQRLELHLGVTPGAVSVFAVANDRAGAVELIIDEAIWQAEKVQAHPLRNTATVAIAHAALEAFLENVGHVPRIMVVP